MENSGGTKRSEPEIVGMWRGGGRSVRKSDVPGGQLISSCTQRWRLMSGGREGHGGEGDDIRSTEVVRGNEEEVEWRREPGRGGVEVAWDSRKGELREERKWTHVSSPDHLPFHISTLLYLNHSSLIEFVAHLWVCPL